MNLVETIYQKSLDLPPEKAQQVIEFIDFIKTRSSASPTISLQSAFEESGLIGYLETYEQLSTTYKDKLNVTTKQSNHRLI